MSLLEEALALAETRGPACTIAVLRNRFPERAPEIDELIVAVIAQQVQASKAAAVLREAFKVKMSDDVVRRHAQRRCLCRS